MEGKGKIEDQSPDMCNGYTSAGADPGVHPPTSPEIPETHMALMTIGLFVTKKNSSGPLAR